MAFLSIFLFGEKNSIVHHNKLNGRLCKCTKVTHQATCCQIFNKLNNFYVEFSIVGYFIFSFRHKYYSTHMQCYYNES